VGRVRIRIEGRAQLTLDAVPADVVRKAVLLLVVVSALTVLAGPASLASASDPPTAPGARLTALHLPASFVAQEVAAAAGKVWVLGYTAPDDDTDCALVEVTPATMASSRFALPACATYMAAGDGRLFLVAEALSAPSNVRAYHIEVFDPSNHLAQVLAPLDLSNVGSAIAHMGFAYGDGALWLYGYSYPAAEPAVVRISPTSGAVEAATSAVPPIGGIFPAVAADGAGTWLGGGPGGAPGVEWVRPGASAGSTAYAGPADQNSSVLWLSAVDDRVWAGIADYRSSNGPGRISVTTHLVALRPDGSVAFTSPAESTSDAPVVATGGRAEIWGLAVGETCGGPERLVQIDPASGRVRRAISLHTAPNGCDAGGGSALLAAVGHDVFALVPSGPGGTSVLYRAAT
jgi:hypothetical protein